MERAIDSIRDIGNGSPRYPLKHRAPCRTWCEYVLGLLPCTVLSASCARPSDAVVAPARLTNPTARARTYPTAARGHAPPVPHPLRHSLGHVILPTWPRGSAPSSTALPRRTAAASVGEPARVRWPKSAVMWLELAGDVLKLTVRAAISPEAGVAACKVPGRCGTRYASPSRIRAAHRGLPPPRLRRQHAPTHAGQPAPARPTAATARPLALRGTRALPRRVMLRRGAIRRVHTRRSEAPTPGRRHHVGHAGPAWACPCRHLPVPADSSAPPLALLAPTVACLRSPDRLPHRMSSLPMTGGRSWKGESQSVVSEPPPSPDRLSTQ